MDLPRSSIRAGRMARYLRSGRLGVSLHQLQSVSCVLSLTRTPPPVRAGEAHVGESATLYRASCMKEGASACITTSSAPSVRASTELPAARSAALSPCPSGPAHTTSPDFGSRHTTCPFLRCENPNSLPAAATGLLMYSDASGLFQTSRGVRVSPVRSKA